MSQLAEAHRSFAECRHDQHRPFVADTLQERADGAAILTAVIVPWFQKSASLR
jgi:hypothetical protein